ncbi:MAG: hypothetical protein J3R72DRAFT_445695 [Linnemannia gamsii]|nr:MAG: hypothetical protein J3R72DRAFT_445695 [Linnemannia gamsii]
MTSTTSIRQEVLLPTLDQHFQYRQENDNSAQIQQRGSYSDNEDGNTLQPLSDQQRQAPGAQERDSPVPRSCGCNSCRRSNSRNKISADTPPRPPSHQQQQLSQQEQYGTTVVSSTQQDSWIRPGSRSSLELPILSPKPSRPSSSLSPCFPTYTYSPTTIATATRFGFSLSDQPDISTTTPPLTPELPQPHQQHIVVVVTPAPDAAVTPLMSLPPSPSPSFPSDPLFPLISSSSSFPASSLFKTTNTSQGPHPTATASSLSTGQHTVQHTASTAKAATSPSPPISHLQRVQSLSRPQSTHSNQSFLTSSYLSSTSFSSAASSFISSSTSISSPSPGPGLAIRTQTLASTPSCASSSSSPSSSPRSSTECHCSSCSDWQTSIAPKAQSLGNKQMCLIIPLHFLFEMDHCWNC